MTARLCGVVATLAVALTAAVLAVQCLRTGEVLLPVLPSSVPILGLDFGVTLLAVPFLALLSVLAFAVALWSLRRGRPQDALLIAAFSATMVAVLIARSVASFFLAWEAMSLVSAFLVAVHHEDRGVRRATFVYVAMAQVGALCILVALLLLALACGSGSFGTIARLAAGVDPGLRNAAFALALVGFGSKAGLMPLHFWLPLAHPVAPANASAMLSGAMLKVALYGLCLVAFVLAAPGPPAWGITLVAIGTLSAVGGVIYALVDHDLKRLLAYHSVENVGIIAIGLGVALLGTVSGDGALVALALTAAFFHTINHGLFKGLLFLGAGTVVETYGTADLERLGGAWSQLAWTAPLFLVGCAAITGLPPFNGFASEWLTFQSLINGLAGGTSLIKLVLLGAIAGLALTGGLAAACFVKVFGIVFLGRWRAATPHAAATAERCDPSVVGQGLLAALCTGLGLAPLLAVRPLERIAAAIAGSAPIPEPTLPVLPVTLALLPFAGALVAAALAAQRGIRRVPTWTCGSPVTAAAQYTATAFSKPLRTIFAFALLPDRKRAYDVGPSPWFPIAIRYHTESRYLIDEAARRFSAAALRLSRRTRIVQSGSLRLYLAYAIAALVVTVALTR